MFVVSLAQLSAIKSLLPAQTPVFATDRICCGPDSVEQAQQVGKGMGIGHPLKALTAVIPMHRHTSSL